MQLPDPASGPDFALPLDGERDPRARFCLQTGAASLALAGSALLAPLMALAQPVPRVARIGTLWQTPPPPPPHPHLVAMLKALQDKGWQDGRAASIDHRYGGGDASRLAVLAQELVALKVDVIVTVGDLATHAARQATATLPIVAVVGFPVESGFVASLARPGGNITGVGVYADDLAVKRLELLKELRPAMRRVAVLWDPVTHERQRSLAEAAARPMGLQAQVLSPGSPEDLTAAFEAAVAARSDAMLVLVSPAFIAQRTRLVQLAAMHRMPSMYTAQTFTDVGGLIAYGPGFDEIWRLGSGLIDDILRGARPADLPVQRPSRIRLDLNLRTARELGIAVPKSILVRADGVAE